MLPTTKSRLLTWPIQEVEIQLPCLKTYLNYLKKKHMEIFKIYNYY